MSENESCSHGVRLWQIAGGAVLVFGLIAVVKNMPDIVRYMRIRSM